MQCQLFNANRIVQRPYGDTIVASSPNMVLEFDFLYIQESREGPKYLLVVKDKFSGFTMLTPSVEADSDTAVIALLLWTALFGTAEIWVSDRGTHFKNKVMKALADALLLKQHHFTTPYCPWSNGSVERLNRTVLTIIRKLLSENNIPDKEWPSLVHLFMKIINETPSSARGNNSPRKLFTFLDTVSPLAQTAAAPVFRYLADDSTIRKLKLPADFDEYVVKLQSDLDTLHSNVFEHVKNNVKRRQGQRLLDSAVHIPNFAIGDLVLHADVQSKFRRKLLTNWTGPYRIVDTVNEFVFRLQDLLDPEVVIESHIMRMRNFVGQKIITNDLIDQIRYDRKQITYEKFVSLALTQGSFYLTVKWLGFSVNENSSETFESCYAHNPTMVIAYLHSIPKSADTHKYVSRLLKLCRQLDEL
jgi:hypothetical protein